MFKNIINNWCQRKENKRKKQFKNGYDYAVNELISGRHTPIALESYFYTDLDHFDNGMKAGIQDTIAKGLVEDDRI